MRLSRKERRAHAKRMRELPEQLTEVPSEEWPKAQTRARRIGVWRCRHWLVQEFIEDEDSGIVRLSVNRTEIGADGRWSDNLTWDELQFIKNELGHGDRDAVEVYPREQDVVNVANMRHLWVLPDLVPFAWRLSPAREEQK